MGYLTLCPSPNRRGRPKLGLTLTKPPKCAIFINEQDLKCTENALGQWVGSLGERIFFMQMPPEQTGEEALAEAMALRTARRKAGEEDSYLFACQHVLLEAQGYPPDEMPEELRKKVDAILREAEKTKRAHGKK